MVEQTQYLLLAPSDLETAMRGVCALFGSEYRGGGNTYHAKNGDIELQLTLVTGGMEGEEAQEFFRRQISGVWGHFREVETEYNTIRVNLLHQIRMTGCFCIAAAKWDEADSEAKAELVRERLATILDAMGGLLLTDGGRELRDVEGRLLLDDRGRSEADGFYPLDPHDPGRGAPEHREQLDRRVRSMKHLREWGIFAPAWLPLLDAEAETPFRSVAEIAERAACLLAVALHAECICTGETPGTARGYSDRVLDSYACREALSPRERAFLANKEPKEREAIHFSWQYECLAVMLWALGLWELPFPDAICDVPGVAGRMRELDPMRALLDAAEQHRRSHAEWLDEADLIYRLDWACVDARVNGLAAPRGMDGGVVVERHKSLNWLIGDGERAAWDDVDTST